jgi:hypothetical protein
VEPDLVRSKSIDSGRSKLLQQRILDSVATHKCFRVKDLVVQLQHTYNESMSIEEIQNAIKTLESEKKITLLEPGTEGHFFHYLIKSYNGLSLWLTAAATCSIIALIFLVPSIEPWSYMRMITGAIFVMFIPGNALVQLLFPHRNMEQTEHIVLSVGLSIAVVCIIGLMLKYVLSTLTVESAIISIGILSITISAVANYSHFLSSKKSEGLSIK